MMAELVVEAEAPKTLMIDVATLKTHRTALTLWSRRKD